MPDARSAQPILVKRYAQARLYDPAAGRYVTLAQLRAWAASGMAVTVIEAETGADITRVLLA